MTIAAIRDEIRIAREQLAALVEETNFELWDMDAETDLLGLVLKMAEWERNLTRVAQEMGL